VTPDTTVNRGDGHDGSASDEASGEVYAREASGEAHAALTGISIAAARAYYRAPPTRFPAVIATASLVRFREFAREWGAPPDRAKNLEPVVLVVSDGDPLDSVRSVVLPWWRVLIPAVLSGGTTAAGLLLMIVSVTSDRSLLNPYIEFGLFLGGLVLVATFVASVRGSGWTIE
jgi:hypothetical protein